MKERFRTLVYAGAALLLFLVMFMHGEGDIYPSTEASRPTTIERAGNGYWAARAWLAGAGIRVLSLRERAQDLVRRADLHNTGNLLIVTLPGTEGFRSREIQSLLQWVRDGNSLLVLAALSDSPDWALGGSAQGEVASITGLELKPIKPSVYVARQRLFEAPIESILVANRPHAYFEGLSKAIALSDYPTRSWTAQPPPSGFVLELAHRQGTDEGVLWSRPLGSGRILVSSLGSLFTNRAIGLSGNARLLANIVGANVLPDGAVIFDDFHQGLLHDEGRAYDPAQFYRDPRLYATLAILFAVWLAWVLGSTRLRVPVTVTPAPREMDLLRATGGFFARVLASHVAALALFDHFFKGVNLRLKQRSAEVPWEFLERHPGIAAHDLAQLEAWYAQAHAGQRVPLMRLYNLILRIERHMA